MAVFGTIEEEPDPEFRATLAGIEFQKSIDEMNEERIRVGKDSISIGVGINTGILTFILGLLLAGFIGSSQRLEYTVIGDSVNVAARLCSECDAEKVFISESTYNVVKNDVHCRTVGPRQLKGKLQEVMVYEAIRARKKST